MNNVFTANRDALTLHIRMTKKCNADCSYCSSFETNSSRLMSLKDLKISLDFIKEKIQSLQLGGQRNVLTVQYIGGELLTISPSYLAAFTSLVKQELAPLFKEFRHGGQSNLIASPARIDGLMEIFDQNIGTSFDHFTGQRTVNKNAGVYQSIFLKNISHIKKNYGKNLSGVIVIDKKMATHVEHEVDMANKRKSHVTLRPVFNGGSPVEKLSLQEIENIYERLFEQWFLKHDIIIEPFFSYLHRRWLNLSGKEITHYSGCPSQHNCAMVSLNLEPDGSIYTCQDLADSKQLQVGNSITGQWNEELFAMLSNRTHRLERSCLECDYFKECQGGCMKEAVEHHGGDIYGKTLYCSIWKKIFSMIDQGLQKNEASTIEKWIGRISSH